MTNAVALREGRKALDEQRKRFPGQDVSYRPHQGAREMARRSRWLELHGPPYAVIGGRRMKLRWTGKMVVSNQSGNAGQ